jgi:hypothetical protein
MQQKASDFDNLFGTKIGNRLKAFEGVDENIWA